MLRRAALGLVSALLLALSSGACTTDQASDDGVVGDSRAALASSPVPVVFDSDMDFDDAMALAFLCQEHKRGRIALRAVTVTENGASLPGAGIQHARCVLARCGLASIPVADGSLTAPDLAPVSIRVAGETLLETALLGCTESLLPSTPSADVVLTSIVEASPEPVAILTSGPVSNVASAIRLSRLLHPLAPTPPFVEKTRSLTMMTGAVHVPGNMPPDALPQPDGTQEINAWIDPPSLRQVVAAYPPGVVRIVPLDATQFVPLTPAFVARLAADRHTPEAELVHAIVSNPLITVGGSVFDAYWWDPLTAMATTRESLGVVGFQTEGIAIVETGAAAGRTAPDPNGHPVRVGVTANASLFEDVFLDTLNGR